MCFTLILLNTRSLIQVFILNYCNNENKKNTF